MYYCTECNEPGVPQGGNKCEICGAEQVEQFREGWDESD